MNLNAYLLFDGNCAEAMTFYQSCFGGELSLTIVGESPAREQMPVEQHDKVVNAKLKTNYFTLFGSDWLHPTRFPVQGNTVCLFLNGGTYENLNDIFERLSVEADESLIDPLRVMFFGTYGALTDKYGVRWMFQGETSPQ